ncbi:nucleoside phosphorylase domain-containing protein [Trichoderma austrokoningii]
MSSNISISNYGSGPQNVATGDGPQNNNNAGGIQINGGSFSGFNPFLDLVKIEIPQVEKQSELSTCSQRQPRHREDFQVAVICALAFEYDAVSLLFDQFWDKDDEPYGRAQGDANIYTTGRIGNHNVVLALLLNMGVAAGAGSAATFRLSYPGLKTAFLVGVCSGVPDTGQGEILLGDVVISKTVIQYGLGRQYPGAFVVKDTVSDNLGRPSKAIRTLITAFETERGRRRLRQKAGQYLKDLQQAAVEERRRYSYQYPGVAEDKLFPAAYLHKHRELQTYSCKCHEETDSFCDEAAHASCTDLRCDEEQLVPRKRLEMKKNLEAGYVQCPEVFIGCVASGDVVMTSGEYRDQLAKQRNIIAFEMEGAGVWDEVPCIVVKGVCDYADSHKNKTWQPFAAATAAAVLKAMLAQYPLTDMPLSHPSYAVTAGLNR